MNLSDNVIGHIAQIVQLAILTGTDVVDHLRSVELVQDTDTGKLFLTEEYQTRSEVNIQRMIGEIEILSNDEV